MRKQVMFHHRKEHEKKDSAVLTDEQMSNGWRVFLMIRANVRNKVGSWWGLFRTKQNQNEGRRPRKKKNWHPTLGNHEKQQWPRPCLTSPFLKTKKQQRKKRCETKPWAKPKKVVPRVVPGKTTDMLFEDVKDFIPKPIIDALDTFHRKSCVDISEVPQVELPHSFGVKVSRKKGKRETKRGGGR